MVDKENDRDLKLDELGDVNGGGALPLNTGNAPALAEGAAALATGMNTKNVPDENLPGHMRVPPKASSFI